MRRFIVVAHARSGSNLLVRGINAHPNALCFGEIMKPRESVDHMAGIGATPEELDQMRMLHAGDTAGFAERFFEVAARRPVRAAGFKLFYYHARDKARGSIWDLVATDENLTFVHLHRPNTFDSYLSRELASATNVWVQPEGKANVTDYGTDVEIDVEAFLEYHEMLKSHVEEANQRLDPARTLALTYDELTQKYDQAMAGVHSHLGLRDIESMPELARQRTRSRWEYVRNANEVRAFLAEHDLGHLA